MRAANLCRAGHLVEGANAYRRKNGYDMCRACLADRRRELQQREKGRDHQNSRNGG